MQGLVLFTNTVEIAIMIKKSNVLIRQDVLLDKAGAAATGLRKGSRQLPVAAKVYSCTYFMHRGSSSK